MRLKMPKQPAEETDGRRKRGLTIPAIAIAVAVVGAALLLKVGGQAPPEPPAPEPSPVANGPIVEADPVVLSLIDGNYLKVGVAFQLRAQIAEGEGEGADDTEEFASARALDLVVSTYSGYTSRQLIPPRGRAAAKELLTERVISAYGGQVTDVYLTTFVVQ